MASVQVLRQRIRSVKNTKQITKAMQLVAASKMRRAQETTKASAPYSSSARELLASIGRHQSAKHHPLFMKRTIKNRLIIVIASDKGLAGAYNANIMKLYAEQLIDDRRNGIDTQTITIGRKAAQFAARLKDSRVVGAYEELPDNADSPMFKAILNSAVDKFVSREVDAVDVIFTEFISMAKQQVDVVRVLPAGLKFTDKTDDMDEADYEPSAQELLDAIAYRLVEARIFQTLLESRASEHSMRMVAMKNATDNAADLISDLTLVMNKSRQGAITQELAEISGGVEAINL
ncbi:ATP synthase F1 subunit gamma [Candidatus Saccharibacteria bacterium]|nr:ATP synthase F1 subunit gamma [Candidatus Saccharibacteria bacterium]